jgi:hypothetical protein
MKIRVGFVSNSSSSSFVIVGCALTRAEVYDFMAKFEGTLNARDDVWYELNKQNIFVDNDYLNIVGKCLADFDEDEVKKITMSLDEIKDLFTEVEKINSPIIFVDAYSEGANIISTFNSFPKNKKYVLLCNGWFDIEKNKVDQDYTLIVWNYFMMGIGYGSTMPKNIEYWQKDFYNYYSTKENLFCCLVGNKRNCREIFTRKLLDGCKNIDNFIFNYNARELKGNSRHLDINYDFNNYNSYNSMTGINSTCYSISYTTPFMLYNTCRFYLIVETNINFQYEFHLTEKTLKPILAGMPFVLMASPRYLEKLRSLGFRTFNELWDEGYDYIELFEERIDAIIKLIQYLNSEFDWNSNIEKLQEITNHNKINLMYNNSIIEQQIISFAQIIKDFVK